MEKVKLTQEDWDVLLPETNCKIGNQKLQLRPLSITEVKRVSVLMQGATVVFAEKKITQQTYKQPENIAFIADMIATEAPDIISDCAGLDIEDVKKLPFDKLVDIVRQLIEINLNMKNSLEKNFKALTVTIQSLLKMNG